MKNLRILALGLLFALYGSSHLRSTGPLSLFFEEKHGQAPPAAKFLARGRGYNIALTSQGNQVALRQAGRAFSLTTQLVGADPAAVIRGESKQAGKVHYLRGSASLTDIPTYAHV